MRTSSMMTSMTALAVFALAGAAHADFYFSVANGDWNDPGTWYSGPIGGPYGPASGAPGATDDVQVSNSTAVAVNSANAAALSVTVASGASLDVDGYTLTVGAGQSNGLMDVSGTLTIQNSGVFTLAGSSPTFVIQSGGSASVDSSSDLNLNGSSPIATIGGTITVNGAMNVSASGQPDIYVQSSQSIPASTTGVLDLRSSGSQPRVFIDSGVTMTNDGTIRGTAKFLGNGSNVGTFTNNYYVIADAASAVVWFDSSLSALNGASGSYIQSTHASSTVRISEPTSGLNTNSHLEILAGQVWINVGSGNAVSQPDFRADSNTTLLVDFNTTLTVDVVSGSGSGLPANSATITAGTHNY